MMDHGPPGQTAESLCRRASARKSCAPAYRASATLLKGRFRPVDEEHAEEILMRMGR
jgi:hypothetical protein